MNPTPKSVSPGLFPSGLVKDELEKVETMIRAQVRDFDPAIEPYVSYVCNTSGKRIRPALAALVGGAAGHLTADHVKLGVILELIHMATLVHDDIIDGAVTRRMVPTAKWGNSLSVLLGDALFSHALTLATDFGCIVICRKVGDAARQVCQGEILQTQRRFDAGVTKDEYRRMVAMKTGALFAAATGLAARLAKQDGESEERLYGYGMKLGTAYQIYDDCLDLVGSEAVVGKTLRTDLLKGKLTLPVLNLLESADPAARRDFLERFTNRDFTGETAWTSFAGHAAAMDRAVDEACGLLEGCRKDLAGLADTPYLAALEQITMYLGDLLGRCRP